jgi:hypothetical protein
MLDSYWSRGCAVKNKQRTSDIYKKEWTNRIAIKLEDIQQLIQ